MKKESSFKDLTEREVANLCAEEKKPEGPTIEIGDKVTSSIATEKYVLMGELKVVGFDKEDENLIAVMTKDRGVITLHRDELDSVIKGDETFDL